MATVSAPAELFFTPDPEANRLIATDANALLIGFALDQQVTVQKAFSGPLELKRRLGHLDPARIAATPPEDLAEVFRARPAIHRFPGAMAERVQKLCAAIAADYGGDGGRVWTEAASGADLKARLAALPGIGDMKVRSLTAVVVKRFGVQPPGYEDVLPNHPTLGDVDSPEALDAYQAAKRAHKAAIRAAKTT
ncbi:MAG TPA: HhH-GPD-type base excision DNA repair protein [Gaiellales bacterium]